MEKKGFSDIDNKKSVPNKDMVDRRGCKHPQPFTEGKISDLMIGDDRTYDAYLWDLDDDPYSTQISIGPELQILGIKDMVLFVGNLVFKSRNGIVVLIKDNTGHHSLFIPTQEQNYRQHASILAETTHQLLNSKVFKQSIDKRMNEHVSCNSDFIHNKN